MQAHIYFQYLIYRRYINLLFSAVFFNAFSIFILGFFSVHKFQTNVPLLIYIINMIAIGPFFCDIFSAGKAEIHNYSITPWVIPSIVMSKIIVLVSTIILFPLPFIIGSTYKYHIPIQDFGSVVIFLLMTFPVYILFGNYATIWSRDKDGNLDSSKILSYQIIVTATAMVPYFILELWLGYTILCVLFGLTVLVVWYFVVLPKFTRNLEMTVNP